MKRRSGILLMEATISMVAMAVAVTFIAQLALYVYMERQRAELHADLLVEASNVLENARSQGSRVVTADWAGRQHLSESVQSRWPGAILKATVKAESGNPDVVRVTVEARGKISNSSQSITLTTLFTARDREVSR